MTGEEVAGRQKQLSTTSRIENLGLISVLGKVNINLYSASS